MKIVKQITFILITSLICSCTITNKANQVYEKPQNDTSKKVSTTGFFEGVIINKYGYKINEYYIALSDISPAQLEMYKGKNVTVTGILNIRDETTETTIQSTKELRKYILQPQFTFAYE